MRGDIDLAPKPLGEIVEMGKSPAESALAMAIHGSASKETREAYAGDLRRFFEWRGMDLTPSALIDLCGLDEPQIALVLNEYKLGLRARGLAPASINRPLASIRTLLRIARRVGLTKIDPAGLVDNEKRRRVRDVRGPSVDEIEQMMAAAAADKSLKGLRTYALCRLAWENALREDSISRLSIEDYDPKRKELRIYYKGDGNVQRSVAITPRVIKAVDAYLEARCGRARLDNGSPLFVNMTTNRPGRLTVDGVAAVLEDLSMRVLGRRVSPHKWRHSAATTHYGETKDLVATQKLLGHKSTKTTEEYLDDDGRQQQGQASSVLSKVA